MKKIPSLFARNYDSDYLVRNELIPGTEWVIEGEGFASRKWDGTACMVRGGELFKRYDASRQKNPPSNWEPAQENPDPVTGHWPGWVPVSREDPNDKWHIEAWNNMSECLKNAGVQITYELVGPKINGGHENFREHILIAHGSTVIEPFPRNFEEIRNRLKEDFIEGVVWHHPDGRMAKIKKKDFGFCWPVFR